MVFWGAVAFGTYLAYQAGQNLREAMEDRDTMFDKGGKGKCKEDRDKSDEKKLRELQRKEQKSKNRNRPKRIPPDKNRPPDMNPEQDKYWKNNNRWKKWIELIGEHTDPDNFYNR